MRFVFIGMIVLFVVTSAFAAPTDQPLLYASDMTYLGYFDVPHNDGAGNPIEYGGHAMSYNPARNSLYMACHVYYDKLTEISIPSTLGPGSTATVLQNCKDVTEGTMDSIAPRDTSGKLYGGVFPYNGRLIVSGVTYYDASNAQDKSHGVSGLDISVQNDFSGFGEMTSQSNIRSVAGTMEHIPPEWQSLLGGTALTGNCCLSIITASSVGPSVAVFDPDDVDGGPLSATTLLFYPEGQGALGDWSELTEYWSMATVFKGFAFPPGTRSVLFFGRYGTTSCYGIGGVGGECNDPCESSKGNHGYPYVHRVMAYDANDLLDVKNGLRNPEDILPYAYWDIEGMSSGGCAEMESATYDPASGRVYITAYFGSQPKVHVYQLGDPTPPVCGDGACNGPETCSSCSQDCGACPVCGNGVLESGEACDDGNTNNGDGCSSSCQVEAGWEVCPEGAITELCLCDGQRSSGYCCSGSYVNSVACVSSADCSGSDVCISPNTCSARCGAVDISSGLVSYWAFDEGSGTVASDSFGSNDGVLTGGSWASGHIGGAYSFSGDNQYMRAADDASISGLSAVTVSAWINAAAYRSSCDGDNCYNFIVAKSNWADNREYRLRYHSPDGDIYFHVSPDGSSYPDVHFDAATFASAGEWHHVVGTWDSATGDVLLYADGVLRDSGTLSASSLYDGSAAFSVGSSGNNAGGSSDDWLGLVDDVRVYNRALAPEEILVLFEGGSSCHWADSDCGGTVGISELVSVITSWMSGERSISELVEVIQMWQNG